MTFAKVAQNTFNELQVDAGVLLKKFNIESPELIDEDIICATTGGINPSCVPKFSDWGSDVDNCPNDTMELKHIDGYECTLGFTALNTTPETIKMSIGAADITDGQITPRDGLSQDDFNDVWWVGDRSDGGLVAICLKNALSTGGLSLQTTNKGKGQLTVTLTGHYSLKNIKKVPMEFYVSESND